MTAERRLAMAFRASTIVMVLAVAMARSQAMPGEKQQLNANDQAAAWNHLRSMVATWTGGDDDGVNHTVQSAQPFPQGLQRSAIPPEHG